jgi:hypothetical protein
MKCQKDMLENHTWNMRELVKRRQIPIFERRINQKNGKVIIIIGNFYWNSDLDRLNG